MRASCTDGTHEGDTPLGLTIAGRLRWRGSPEFPRVGGLGKDLVELP